MKLIEKRIYLIYILLGSLYFISKVIYYTCGFVCLGGLMLGLVATVLTILIGIGSLQEYRKASKPVVHWLAVIGPLLIILYSPLHMTIRMGIPVIQFPLEKFTILLIFECLAIAQLILAILMVRGLIFKPGTNERKIFSFRRR
ncbi:MAG: hypothetical protein H8D22_07570 [Candidatus Cloacimonetes bacterium]|nr:hypothetical protein [Candidatus Cloacimonadota bacterium]